MRLPVELQILAVCASIAALVVALQGGIITIAVACAIYLVIVGLTGWP